MLTTTTDVKLGKFYAGKALPAGSKVLGTVSRSPSDTGALLELENGVQVQFNAGVIRNLPGKKGKPLKYGEVRVPLTLKIPTSVHECIPDPKAETLERDAIAKYGKKKKSTRE